MTPLRRPASLFIILLLLHVVGSPAFAQTSVSHGKFEGRDAYVLENEKARLTLLSGGGYIGEIRFKSANPKLNINPMRVPHYLTIDPQDYDPERHDKLYGEAGDRKVMAGYMGHFLCFPYFGGSNSSYEKALGYGAHGEAAVVEWKIDKMDTETSQPKIFAQAELPLTQFAVTRKISADPEHAVFQVEEAVTNHATFDRPFQWVQHLTFGNPFVEFGKTFADAPVSKIAFSQKPGDVSPHVDWRLAKTLDGTTFNASRFDTNAGEGSYRGWLLNPNRAFSWTTIYHTEYEVLIGYLFPKELNPWIGDWQENGSKKHMPWNGQAVARGLLIGTSPFTTGIKRSNERGPLFDTPTVAWIGAKETLSQTYLIFLAEIGSDFKGVSEITSDSDSISITERNTGKIIRISTHLTL